MAAWKGFGWTEFDLYKEYMPFGRIISTNGPYLEAEIEVDGTRLTVMDELILAEKSIPSGGLKVEFEFSPDLFEDEPWESIFSGNPSGKIGLEHIAGWRYRAFGKIVSVDPVLVDCGLVKVEDPISTHDHRVVGEFVAFTIGRLGVRAI